MSRIGVLKCGIAVDMNLIMTLEWLLETLAGACRDIYINDQLKHEGFLLGSLNSLGVIHLHP